MGQPIQESSSVVFEMDLDQPYIVKYFKELPMNNNLISSADLLEIVENDLQEYYILDIRREEDYQAGHIEGSNNVWWHELGNSLEDLPKD